MGAQIVNQAHFVPVVYQSNFTDPAGWIRGYERGRPTVTRKPKSVGWERGLYAIESPTGDVDQILELELGGLERSIAPVLRMLNALKSHKQLSADETALLMTFVAHQALRTPSARTRLTKIDFETLSSVGMEPAVTEAVRSHVAKKPWWLNSIGRLTASLVNVLSHKTMTIYRIRLPCHSSRRMIRWCWFETRSTCREVRRRSRKLTSFFQSGAAR